MSQEITSDLRPRCAYCGSATNKRTKEHLWPAGLHKRVLELRESNKQVFWLSKLEKELETEPTIRDVCNVCNNGPLSILDTYICEVFDREFSIIRQRDEQVSFEFNYHLLKRWLLKISYNSARIHKSDVFAFHPLLPYILGHNLRQGRSVKLFLDMTYPGVIPAEERSSGEPFDVSPDANRVGWFYYNSPAGKKLLRAVHIRSFSFYLAFFSPDHGTAAAKDFTADFLRRRTSARELRASEDRVSLLCNGIDAWTSLKSGREHRLAFSQNPPRAS